jgi:Putative cyclase
MQLTSSDGPRYGKHDELGTLNRLTNDVVLSAAQEIKTGTRISMNWPLDAQNDVPFFGRQAFHKHVYQKPPRIVNDDTWSFNTQSSSQWDGKYDRLNMQVYLISISTGLRHFAYQKEARFYNGVTLDDIHGPNATNVNGIHAWSEKGIVGRGILVDYAAWRSTQNPPIPYDPFKTGSIPLGHLKAVLEAQGTQVKFGDILIIRSGYMKAYKTLSREELVEKTQQMPPGFAGVEQSEEMLEWIWSNFSAVAGDHPSFECWRKFIFCFFNWRLRILMEA